MTPDADRPDPPIRRSIPSLTGVRGVAAVWVFLTHFYGLAAGVLPMPSLLGSLFLFNGFRGVDLFFVLSGFILMHVHADQFRTFRKADLKRFGIARFFRIYPINTAVLIVLLVFVLAAPGYVAFARHFSDGSQSYKARNLSPAGFVQSLLLVQSWTVLKLGEWNIVSWTLSAEVLGYILFPVLAWATMRERSAVRCAVNAGASLVLLTMLLILFHHANNNPTGTFGAIRMFFCFYAGIALHRCYQLSGERLSKMAPALTVLGGAFVAMTLLVPALPLLDVFGFAVLILGLAYRRGPVNTVLESSPALFLGKISFSFYLIHFLIIQVVTWSIARWLTSQILPVRLLGLASVPAACVLLAVLCHRLIETPSQRLGKRLAAKP